MFDLASNTKLAPLDAQLPVNVYFDEALLKREIEQLFFRGPRYVGHELMVPKVGDYATLAHENEGRMLVRNARGIELMSNVCRHRQAKMLDGRGSVGNIVCPLHRWTYDLKGELTGAPHFDATPACISLSSAPLQSWGGLLFEQNGFSVAEKLAQLEPIKEFDFSGYQFDHLTVHECDYNWKTFIEVYMEDYHVDACHPGLGSFVRCDQLEWRLGKDCAVQTVGFNRRQGKSGSLPYMKWQELALQSDHGETPKYGAVWLALYPNVTVECYPHMLVISTLWPRGPQKTTNVIEFYFPEEIALFEPDAVAAMRAAYMETAAEDDEVARRMDAGRRVLRGLGANDSGPYQSPMEDGTRHFHEWYRSQ